MRRHIELAQQLAGQIRESEGFELAVEPPLNLVCFRHVAGDALNEQLLDRLNASGNLYMTHTMLNEQYTLRLCVGQRGTEARHVQRAWERIQATAAELA